MVTEWFSINWDSDSQPSQLFESVRRHFAGVTFVADSPRTLNEVIAGKFLEGGWAQTFKLPGSNMSVSFLRERTAACVQLGNVARVFADLLKLQNLFDRKLIDHAILLVPSDALSKQFGANHASFGRVVRDLETLALSLSCPILVMSVS